MSINGALKVDSNAVLLSQAVGVATSNEASIDELLSELSSTITAQYDKAVKVLNQREAAQEESMRRTMEAIDAQSAIITRHLEVENRALDQIFGQQQVREAYGCMVTCAVTCTNSDTRSIKTAQRLK